MLKGFSLFLQRFIEIKYKNISIEIVCSSECQKYICASWEFFTTILQMVLKPVVEPRLRRRICSISRNGVTSYNLKST